MHKNILKKTLAIVSSTATVLTVGTTISSCSSEDTTPRLENVTFDKDYSFISNNEKQVSFTANVTSKYIPTNKLDELVKYQ